MIYIRPFPDTDFSMSLYVDYKNNCNAPSAILCENVRTRTRLSARQYASDCILRLGCDFGNNSHGRTETFNRTYAKAIHPRQFIHATFLSYTCRKKKCISPIPLLLIHKQPRRRPRFMFMTSNINCTLGNVRRVMSHSEGCSNV